MKDITIGKSEFTPVDLVEVSHTLTDPRWVYFVLDSGGHKFAFKVARNSDLGQYLCRGNSQGSVEGNPVKNDKLLDLLSTDVALSVVEIHHQYVMRVAPFTGVDAIEAALHELEVLGKAVSAVRPDGVHMWSRLGK